MTNAQSAELAFLGMATLVFRPACKSLPLARLMHATVPQPCAQVFVTIMHTRENVHVTLRVANMLYPTCCQHAKPSMRAIYWQTYPGVCSISFEQVEMPDGQQIMFRVSWDMSTPPNTKDIVSIIKNDTQVVWWYMSAPSCEYRAECLGTPIAECPLSCRQVGTDPKSKYSLTIYVDSAGEGMYQVKAYSAHDKTIVAEDKVLVLSSRSRSYINQMFPRPSGVPPYKLLNVTTSVPNLIDVTQYGGLFPCLDVPVGGACTAQGDVRKNLTGIPQTPPPTPPPTPSPTPPVWRLVHRCGDGRRSDELGEDCDDGNLVRRSLLPHLRHVRMLAHSGLGNVSAMLTRSSVSTKLFCLTYGNIPMALIHSQSQSEKTCTRLAGW